MTKIVPIEKNKTLKGHFISLVRKSNPGFSVPENTVTLGSKMALEGIVDGVNRHSVTFDIASTNKSYTLTYDPAPELFGVDTKRNFAIKSGETMTAWLTRLRAAYVFPAWMTLTVEAHVSRTDILRVYTTVNQLYINYEAYFYTGSTFTESSFRITVGSYSSVPYKASVATTKYGVGQVAYQVLTGVESNYVPAQYAAHGSHNAISALGLKCVAFGNSEFPMFTIYLDPTTQRLGLSPTATITNQSTGMSMTIRLHGTFDVSMPTNTAISFKYYPKAGDFSLEKLTAIGAYTVGTNLIITLTP